MSRKRGRVRASDHTLGHLVFLDTLAAFESNATPAWRELSAGYLALRLLDSWGAGVCSDDAFTAQVAATRVAVGAIDTAIPTRVLLESLVRAIDASRSGRSTTIRPRLMAYGRTLDASAQARLAMDVYRTVLDLCHPQEDASEVACAQLRLGACLRQSAAWDEAHAAYEAAARAAATGRDRATSLRARCYGAAVTAERGNLPAADRLYRIIEQDAREAGVSAMRGMALHGRAHVAFQRGDFEAAARLAFEALQVLEEPRDRERAMADVAAAFAELGVRSAARDAHLINVATAQDPIVRWSAAINLMELAALDRNEVVFEQHRSELAAVSLPARLAGYYHLYAGTGARTFGRAATARAEYQRALDIATASGLSQLVFQAEAELLELQAATPVAPAPAARAPTRGTAAMATALADLRERALVAGL